MRYNDIHFCPYRYGQCGVTNVVKYNNTYYRHYYNGFLNKYTYNQYCVIL